MAIQATIADAVITNSAPPFVIATWSLSDAFSDSTSLFEIILPGADITKSNLPNTVITNDYCFALELNSISISGSSTNFDVSFLTKEGISNLNTIYEIMKYSNINLSESDNDYKDFIIRNDDRSQTNKLYVNISDNSGSGTGNVLIRMIYKIVQSSRF